MKCFHFLEGDNQNDQAKTMFNTMFAKCAQIVFAFKPGVFFLLYQENALRAYPYALCI